MSETWTDAAQSGLSALEAYLVQAEALATSIAEFTKLVDEWRRETRYGRRARRRQRIKADVASRHQAVLAKHVVHSWADGGGAP
jgi:hypothetical protein